MTIFLGLLTTASAALVAVVVAAMVAVRRGAAPADLAALLPEVARLLVRLLRDRSIPLHVRARILVTVAYNVQPINLIPDFVPVIGLVDNVLVTAWALRSTIRRAGREVVTRNWSGNQAGLAMVFRLAGVEEHPDNSGNRACPDRGSGHPGRQPRRPRVCSTNLVEAPRAEDARSCRL